MKLEKIDFSRPFYDTWKTKYWKCRKKIELVEKIEGKHGTLYLLRFYQAECCVYKTDKWQYFDVNNEHTVEHYHEEAWFRNRERTLRQYAVDG